VVHFFCVQTRAQVLAASRALLFPSLAEGFV
jgi:hypothetical protein